MSSPEMKYHWLDDMDGLIIKGDIIAALSQLEDESVGAIVTDPPYELNFMGKGWDNAGISFEQTTWEACLRVLKPGGHLVVFGGTRTHHRMWVAIEDAGFEVRDMLLWVYGQGFPKSLDAERAVAVVTCDLVGRHCARTLLKDADVDDHICPVTSESKLLEGWGTALKPACEPILLARKPLSEKTVATNVLKHSTGALNIDATRLEYQDEADKASATPQGKTTSKEVAAIGAEPDAGRDLERVEFKRPEQKGRWPANVVLQCTCDDPQPVPEKAQERQDEPSQERRYDKEGATNFAAEPGIRRGGGGFIHEPDCPAGMLDEQVAGISRFFYCPKTSKKERGANNTHPTVKPLALMRWLVRMVTPPDGVVLDPFCGSGSTLIAATEEGFGFIGVDVNEEYVEIALRRLKGRNA